MDESDNFVEPVLWVTNKKSFDHIICDGTSDTLRSAILEGHGYEQLSFSQTMSRTQNAPA
jgi:hypothetical protein